MASTITKELQQARGKVSCVYCGEVRRTTASTVEEESGPVDWLHIPQGWSINADTHESEASRVVVYFACPQCIAKLTKNRKAK